MEEEFNLYKGGRLTQRAKGKHSRTGTLLKAGINRKRFLATEMATSPAKSFFFLSIV